jgi:hypothetical protein
MPIAWAIQSQNNPIAHQAVTGVDTLRIAPTITITEKGKNCPSKLGCAEFLEGHVALSV